MSFSPDHQFHRTQFADGRWASFCVRCLRTVACEVESAALLAESEAMHHCDPVILERLKLKHIGG